MTVTGSVRSHFSPSTSMIGCSGDADEAVAGAAGPRRFSASTFRVPLGSEASAMNSIVTGPRREYPFAEACSVACWANSSARTSRDASREVRSVREA